MIQTILIIIGVALYLLAGLIVFMMFSAQMFLSYNKKFKWPEAEDWLFIVYSFTFIPFVWPLATLMFVAFEMSFKKAYAEVMVDVIALSNEVWGKPIEWENHVYS